MTAALEARHVSKSYGKIAALHDASLSVEPGKVTCLLGDNGAGKSTLIKIMSGVEHADHGELFLEGTPTVFGHPRDALDAGVATVFQDLAMVPIMPVYRNFFLGNEPGRFKPPFTRFDTKFAVEETTRHMADVGIDLRDAKRPISTLSGGERQCVAIARAVYFGARVLILDEPTSALGVRQSEIVLKYLLNVRARGVAVILVTHNPQHAFAVGDSFVILKRGDASQTIDKADLTLTDLILRMSGGIEFERLEDYVHNESLRGQASAS